MKKKVIVIVIVIVFLVLFVPIPMHLKDGGTVEYKALTYKVSKIHRTNLHSLTGYEDGIVVEVFGIKVYEKINKHMDYLD